MKYPEWEKPFYIKVNARILGVAEILSQKLTMVITPLGKCKYLKNWNPG